MDKIRNYTSLKKFCLAQGADIFGVADIKQIKNEFLISSKVLKELNAAICIGAQLSRAVLNEIENQPTRLYFHHYRSVNTSLDQLALRISSYLQNRGFLALPVPASQIVDWQKQTAHLSHKKIGVLAGLGWIGRNNLLVNKKLGSCFRIVTILTDMPLKFDRPVKENCGACHRCMSQCPASAIKENPLEFEHLKCFEKLKEFQRQKLVDQYICGVCVTACRGSLIPLTL